MTIKVYDVIIERVIKEWGSGSHRRILMREALTVLSKQKVEDFIKALTELEKERDEVFGIYIRELKRIKEIYKSEPTRTVINMLIYFSYNNRMFYKAKSKITQMKGEVKGG